MRALPRVGIQYMAIGHGSRLGEGGVHGICVFGIKVAGN